MDRLKTALIFLALTVLLGQNLALAGPRAKAEGDSVTIRVVGVLQTGLFAIGGETTGVAIDSKGITWELELGKNPELKQTAQILAGKRVVVEGSLHHRAGVEIKDRWIITVNTLRPLTK